MEVCQRRDVAALLANHREELDRILSGWAAKQHTFIADALQSGGGDAPRGSPSRQPLASLPDKNPEPTDVSFECLRGSLISESVQMGIPTAKDGQTWGLSSRSSGRLSSELHGAQNNHSDCLHTLQAMDQLAGFDVQKDLDKVVAIGDAVDHACETVVSSHCAACRLLERVHDHHAFGIVCSCVIMLNTVFLVAVTEYHATSPDTRNNTVIEDLEMAFCTFYSFEICIKILCQRLLFFFSYDAPWNIFDAMLVSISLFEMFFTSTGINLSYLRVLRLMKMVKMLKFVRVMRQFHELRMVLDSILGSMKCMMWSIILILTITVMFSLCFVQAVTEFLANTPDDRMSSSEQADLVAKWGSIGRSMLSLFQATTGGNDWAIIAAPLNDVGPSYYAVFMVYVAFFTFVIMNSMTSIFVDTVREYSQSSFEEIIQDQIDRKEQYIEKLQSLFKSMDVDNSGSVSWDEFQAALNSPTIAAFASSMELEVSELDTFFGILSADGKALLDLETFIIGCIKVRGPAKMLDVTQLFVHFKHATDRQIRFENHCAHALDELFRAMSCTTA